MSKFSTYKVYVCSPIHKTQSFIFCIKNLLQPDYHLALYDIMQSVVSLHISISPKMKRHVFPWLHTRPSKYDRLHNHYNKYYIAVVLIDIQSCGWMHQVHV